MLDPRLVFDPKEKPLLDVVLSAQTALKKAAEEQSGANLTQQEIAALRYLCGIYRISEAIMDKST